MIELSKVKPGQLVRVQDTRPTDTENPNLPYWDDKMDAFLGKVFPIYKVCETNVKLTNPNPNDFHWHFACEWLDYAEPEKPLESAPTAETKRERMAKYEPVDSLCLADIRAIPTTYNNVHESVMRSYHIVRCIRDLLIHETPHIVIRDILWDLMEAPNTDPNIKQEPPHAG